MLLRKMCRTSHWTARFLVLVMLVTAFGPLTMACAAQSEAMHCMRKPVSANAAPPAMPCHHGTARSKASQPENHETSFQAVDSCCQSHCCCGATTSEWAQPASNLLSCLSLVIEPAYPIQSAALQSSDVFGRDSARAPPRS